MKTTAMTCLILFAAAGRAPAQPPAAPIKEAALRDAAEKPLALIQQSQKVWYKKDPGCVSCHHHVLPEFVHAEARVRGVRFDAKHAAEITAKTYAHLRDLDTFVQGTNFIDVMDEGWRLFAAHADGVPANVTTSAMAQFLASAQQADGSWRTMDARPPQSHSRFTATAVSAHGVRRYLPDSFQGEKQAVLKKAREWLLKAQPVTTEDRTFQLLGLLWTEADTDVRKKAAQQLLKDQRKDGGWSQVSGEKSDAFSTGEVLYALHHAAGLATNDPVYQWGLQFLLQSQEKDGSWKVESRLNEVVPVSPEYFSAGFPHGRDHQYSSIAGTAWATTAVLQAVPAPKETPKAAALPDFAPPEEKNEWVHVALNGTAAELKAALDNWMSAKAKTKRGTTALMLAARDPEKVKLLLKAGADVNARADSGFTALHVAARYHGNSEVLRLLLKEGAVVNAPKDAKVQFDTAPLFVAATTGDVGMVRLLLDAKAEVDAVTLVLGGLGMTPLVAAVLRNDTAMLNTLLGAKANPNWGNPEKITPLHRAVIANHADTVKVLLAEGAKVNHADKEGFTALHYAAYVNHHDTAVVELLLAAGADLKAKDRTGRTPLEVAKALKHTKVEAVLERKSRR